jgi:hypothetical protein
VTFTEKLALRILLLVAKTIAPAGIRWSVGELADEIKAADLSTVDLQASGEDGIPMVPPGGSLGWNRRVLANIRALLEGKTLDDVAMYKIGGRELAKIPIPDLMRLEASLEARVTAQIRRRKAKEALASRITFGPSGGWL